MTFANFEDPSAFSNNFIDFNFGQEYEPIYDYSFNVVSFLTGRRRRFGFTVYLLLLQLLTDKIFESVLGILSNIKTRQIKVGHFKCFMHELQVWKKNMQKVSRRSAMRPKGV